MANCVLVVGLGWGDEGKGSIVDYLTGKWQAKLVVRYNGGAQAAHSVVLPDGRQHTFAQWGSGTFAGASTHLSKYMLVNPSSMFNEAQRLQAVGVSDPFSLITVHRDAVITTPYHVIANRMKEEARGDGRHGSCGMGIGETMADVLAHPDGALRVRDLESPSLARDKLKAICSRVCPDSAWAPSPSEVAESFEEWRRLIVEVDDDWLGVELAGEGTVVFEGAQGVLLDDMHGFPPHHTWSNTTLHNALQLCAEVRDIRRIGVLRAYATRHGAGPFPTESASAVRPELHNGHGPWQGRFRWGHFDEVLTRYALEACHVDEVALTHIDGIRDGMRCTDYVLSPGAEPIRYRGATTYAHQERLAASLSAARPLHYSSFPGDGFDFANRLEDSTDLGIQIRIRSFGPTCEQKVERP